MTIRELAERVPQDRFTLLTHFGHRTNLGIC